MKKTYVEIHTKSMAVSVAPTKYSQIEKWCNPNTASRPKGKFFQAPRVTEPAMIFNDKVRAKWPSPLTYENKKAWDNTQGKTHGTYDNKEPMCRFVDSIIAQN